MITEAFIEPEWIEIDEDRWEIRIKIKTKLGDVREFVASADSFFTEGSGIWFGTRSEHIEKLNGN